MGSHCTVPFASVVLRQRHISPGVLLCLLARLRCLSPEKAQRLLFAEEPVGLLRAPAEAAEQALPFGAQRCSAFSPEWARKEGDPGKQATTTLQPRKHPESLKKHLPEDCMQR